MKHHQPRPLHINTAASQAEYTLRSSLSKWTSQWLAAAIGFAALMSAAPLTTALASTLPPVLPTPVTNHPVAKLTATDGEIWLSITGLHPGKTWQDLRADGYWWRSGMNAWQPLPPLPQGQGRLAAQLVSANGAFWFFGGYTVAEDGSEVSTPDVYRVTPAESTVYHPQPAMPVPVDDATALVYEDRYIYLISGWHDVGNVNLVQIFDTQTQSWSQGEPWPGAPVFGQAGAIIGQQLAVCGGARIQYPPQGARQFVLSEECWQGTIRADDHRRIDWRPMPPMPGGARYRAAAAGIEIDHQPWIVFLGGTYNPYNYNGIGYDGQPSTAVEAVQGFNLATQQWCRLAPLTPPSMDHRSTITLTDQRVVLIGGMDSQQNVLAHVQVWQPTAPGTEDCSGSL